MKTIVDTRMMHHGGIGTYLRCLLPLLQEKIHLQRFNAKVPIYSFREQLLIPKKIPPCDIFWSPHFNASILPNKGRFLIVTIHDLYHLDHFKTLSLAKQLYIKIIFKEVIQKADKLIAVSEFSKKRLLHYFPDVEEKLTVIHSGCDHLSKLKPKPVEGLPSQFFLCVGNDKPHKNRSVIFEAMRHFPKMHLVIVGPAKETNHKKIYGLPTVIDEELVWLYQNAEGLIFPSLYEGWGLPPLEAMQQGCPVIASSAASIPEACGKAPLYFDPKNSQELCVRLEELPKRRIAMIEEGKKQTAHFTWQSAAENHIDIFNKTFHLL